MLLSGLNEFILIAFFNQFNIGLVPCNITFFYIFWKFAICIEGSNIISSWFIYSRKNSIISILNIKMLWIFFQWFICVFRISGIQIDFSNDIPIYFILLGILLYIIFSIAQAFLWICIWSNRVIFPIMRWQARSRMEILVWSAKGL